MSEKSLKQVALSFWKGEEGAILSAELVLVMTVAVLAMVVGLRDVSGAVNAELEDVAEAFGALSQSFQFSGISSCKSCVSGSSFNDRPDTEACDCVGLNHDVGHIKVQEKCE